jgi:hypothetical protein
MGSICVHGKGGLAAMQRDIALMFVQRFTGAVHVGLARRLGPLCLEAANIAAAFTAITSNTDSISCCAHPQ